MVLLYMVTFTINIPEMLAYIPYMDPMGSMAPMWSANTRISHRHHVESQRFLRCWGDNLFTIRSKRGDFTTCNYCQLGLDWDNHPNLDNLILQKTKLGEKTQKENKSHQWFQTITPIFFQKKALSINLSTNISTMIKPSWTVANTTVFSSDFKSGCLGNPRCACPARRRRGLSRPGGQKPNGCRSLKYVGWVRTGFPVHRLWYSPTYRLINIYPLVNIQKAIENGHRNSGFSH